MHCNKRLLSTHQAQTQARTRADGQGENHDTMKLEFNDDKQSEKCPGAKYVLYKRGLAQS